MAGPTPVSALIHAATMVAAGVFVVARLYPVFLASPTALAVLGVVAAITMLGAALAALAQDDIKRVLAWSTVSQLAYMIGALACGGRDAALYHLLVPCGVQGARLPGRRRGHPRGRVEPHDPDGRPGPADAGDRRDDDDRARLRCGRGAAGRLLLQGVRGVGGGAGGPR